jgi:tRNA C32,U32 (ribose-2'-O)-methylase TrmJ
MLELYFGRQAAFKRNIFLYWQVKPNVVNKANSVVYIPARGCLNLAATVNVVLYDRLAKSTQYEQGNELVRQSRYVNSH